MSPCGFFKTGDVFRRDKRGNYYCADRLKELIKYSAPAPSPPSPSFPDTSRTGLADRAAPAQRASRSPRQSSRASSSATSTYWTSASSASRTRSRPPRCPAPTWSCTAPSPGMRPRRARSSTGPLSRRPLTRSCAAACASSTRSPSRRAARYYGACCATGRDRTAGRPGPSCKAGSMCVRACARVCVCPFILPPIYSGQVGTKSSLQLMHVGTCAPSYRRGGWPCHAAVAILYKPDCYGRNIRLSYIHTSCLSMMRRYRVPCAVLTASRLPPAASRR